MPANTGWGNSRILRPYSTWKWRCSQPSFTMNWKSHQNITTLRKHCLIVEIIWNRSYISLSNSGLKNKKYDDISCINGKTEFDKATEMNSFFANVAKDLTSSIPPVSERLPEFPPSAQFFEFHDVSEYYVYTCHISVTFTLLWCWCVDRHINYKKAGPAIYKPLAYIFVPCCCMDYWNDGCPSIC